MASEALPLDPQFEGADIGGLAVLIQAHVAALVGVGGGGVVRFAEGGAAGQQGQGLGSFLRVRAFAQYCSARQLLKAGTGTS
jgi:hypothetical protein